MYVDSFVSSEYSQYCQAALAKPAVTLCLMPRLYQRSSEPMYCFGGMVQGKLSKSCKSSGPRQAKSCMSSSPSQVNQVVQVLLASQVIQVKSSFNGCFKIEMWCTTRSISGEVSIRKRLRTTTTRPWTRGRGGWGPRAIRTLEELLGIASEVW